MEIYREEPQVVQVPVPQGTSGGVYEITRDGDIISSGPIGDLSNQEKPLADVSIPYMAVRYDGEIRVSLTIVVGGSPINKNYFLTVVTPIMDLDKISDLIGTGDPKETERFVRHIIESYTGQSFGLRVGKEVVQGYGDNRLPLNKKLLSLTSFNVNGVIRPGSGYSVSGDGWFLESFGPRWLEIKEAPPDELLDFYSEPGPIRLPSWYSEKFWDNVNYVLSGEWGYYYVPADVQAAAGLLVNDYACPQSAYRDRYLNIIKSSDWTLEYNERAWEATGNARADQILDKYKRGRIGLV